MHQPSPPPVGSSTAELKQGGGSEAHLAPPSLWCRQGCGQHKVEVCESFVCSCTTELCVHAAPPVLPHRLGDTGVVAEHGSLHQYLRHRHAKDGPIIAFWWTNQQRIVSTASPDVFKATAKLFDRPGMAA